MLYAGNRRLDRRFPRPVRILFLTVNKGERSSAELAQDLVHEAQDLVRLQIDLAKQEVRELAKRNGIAIGLLAFGALLLMLGVLVALPVLLVLLWSNHVLGAVIWLAADVLLGGALLAAGRLLLRLELPRRSLRSFEETRRWAVRQIRSNSR
jgi:hypothetical protein